MALSNEQLIVLCTVGGTLGGAIGAVAGFWATLKVTIALQGAQIRAQGSWIRSLRRSRHEFRGELQKHEFRIGNLERAVEQD